MGALSQQYGHTRSHTNTTPQDEICVHKQTYSEESEYILVSGMDHVKHE